MGHVCILDESQAREVLHYLYKRHKSVRKLAEILGASKSSLHRWLKGDSIPALIRIKLCELIPDEELIQILKGKQLLTQYGILDEEGRLNKTLVLAIIDALMQDETLKEEILNYLLKYYKKDLQERLVEVLPKIELKWTPEFEKWLTEKKSKPISQRTLRDYKNVWQKCLEGKLLGWHLLKQLEGKTMLCNDNKYHPTSWVRQIFRHYVGYLYSQGKLDWDTYSRLLLTVPGRRYGRKVLQKAIVEEDVIVSLKKLKEAGRTDIYMLYLIMLYSAVRFEHVLGVLKNWKPDEIVYVDYLKRNIKRLECFETHCRYYVGKERERKPAGFMFLPYHLLETIEKYKDKLPGKRRIEKVVKRLGCLPPKHIRIYAVRLILQVLGDNDVSKFILSKFGELSVSARYYRNLLEEADKVYPKYLQQVEYLINKSG